MKQQQRSISKAPPIFIISGGAGALGKHVARIVLSQFPYYNPQVIVKPQVRGIDQLAQTLDQIASQRGIVIHTMVDPVMREALVRLAAERNIRTVDTVGDAISHMAEALEQEPLGQPGIYHGQ